MLSVHQPRGRRVVVVVVQRRLAVGSRYKCEAGEFRGQDPFSGIIVIRRGDRSDSDET